MRKKVRYFQVAQGVWGMKLVFVNIYMIANRRGVGKGWVLVDTGIKGSSGKIIAMAESIFGPGTKPMAIVLTHGHADHSGSVKELLLQWDVPVYAHPLEIPYLTGVSAYPPADPFVGGGLMSLLSAFFPKKPIDLGEKVQAIDMSDCIPELPEWRCIHTPGHSPGHISLFLKLNTTLLAGDAFATTCAESVVAVISNLKKISGPPKFLTIDWDAAEQSVRKLAALQPRMAGAGHGPAMRGKELQDGLEQLTTNFKELAVPETGRYVGHPVIAGEGGYRYVPPLVLSTSIKIVASFIGVLAGFYFVNVLQKNLRN